MTRDLAERVKSHARDLGFDHVGIADPRISDHVGPYRAWLDRGAHGEMTYLAREDSVLRRSDLRVTFPDVRSVVVVAHGHYLADPPGAARDRSVGIVARYARGRDYHKVVAGKLKHLLSWLQQTSPKRVEGRIYVDTGPILERELGSRAGLGWFGKNTMLIHPRRGSYFFLGVLLLDLELSSDPPFEVDHCGTCHRCLDACPTGALLGYDESGAPLMDARRCISYLTIELKGAIPVELRPLMGNRIFGCDICQEVCPFNTRFAHETEEPGYAARGPGELPAGVQARPVESSRQRLGARQREDAPLDGSASEERRGTWGADGATDEVTAGTPDAAQRIHPGTRAPSLVELMRMSREQWDAFSRGSAIRRAGYAGFKRNVAVALGNWLASADPPPAAALAALAEAMMDDEPLVREHAAWALEQA